MRQLQMKAGKEERMISEFEQTWCTNNFYLFKVSFSASYVIYLFIPPCEHMGFGRRKIFTIDCSLDLYFSIEIAFEYLLFNPAVSCLFSNSYLSPSVDVKAYFCKIWSLSKQIYLSFFLCVWRRWCCNISCIILKSDLIDYFYCERIFPVYKNYVKKKKKLNECFVCLGKRKTFYCLSFIACFLVFYSCNNAENNMKCLYFSRIYIY